jgi:predicted dehydrogenase
MPNLDISLKRARVESPRPIVLIGAGGIARDAHLPAYKKAGFRVTGIFDLDRAKAQSLADAFAIGNVADSLEQAVRTAPEGAVFDVATPAAALLGVIPHLPNGSGLLMQKPMGETLAQAREIRDLCRSKSLTAAVNFQLRFAPAIQAARRLIAQGAIGDLHGMEVRVSVYTPWHLWTFLYGIPRVEILYHSIHYLDLMRSFLGDPHRIYAKTLKHPKMAQLASTRSTMMLDYGDTISANISTNHGHEFGLKHQESYVKWEGTQGAIKTRLGLLMDYPKGVPEETELCQLSEGSPAEWKRIEVEGSWFPDAFIGTMSNVMNFLDGVDERLVSSVEDAYRTMALVEAAYESSSRGGTPVSYD